ncbi:dipeptidase [Clostridioides difficile]|uniref:dipeptidase n=1 Tax=Clostridioides difficile TaxID=1496 RepID=UPI000BB1C42E|nr:dipeptidase [Clostridioides difficile]PBF77860.1 peptidase M19 [Clostridioides difficile]
MKFIDLHCDTIAKLMENVETSELKSNKYSVDIDRLKKGDSLAQTFALFGDTEEVKHPFDYCMSMANKFHEEMKKNSDEIALATNYEEIMKNQSEGKLTALLSIEEGAVLEGKLENLKKFYDLGVRMMTISWNHVNELSFPHNKVEYREKGLTDFGREVVHKMNELGMLVDVSHISDGGFYEIAKISSKPIIATHSNSRAMMNHSRNLTDDMIKVLANKGGVTGINFFHLFLSDKSESKLEDMVRHIKHIVNVGGIDVVSLGSDFDGIDSKVEIEDISQMGKLYEPLKKEGFSEDDIEKIYYKNALRVIKEVL